MSTDDSTPLERAQRGNVVRRRRLTYALVSGLFSKVLAVAVQWIALPLTLRTLGTDRYAAFLALQALVAWAGLLAVGLAPSLPRFISAAFVSRAHESQRDIFQTAVAYLAAMCAAFVLVMIGLSFVVSPSQMIAVRHIQSGEIFAAYYTVVLVTCVQLLGSIMPSIRSGFQELHYSFMWASAASILVILGLLHIASNQSTISTFLIVIYAPLAAFMLVDMGLICLQRPYLLQGEAQFIKTGKVLAPQAANAMAAQFSFFLVSFLPTLIVAHFTDATQTAVFGSIMQLLLLAGSGMNLIFQPLVPAIANAVAHRDRTWVRKTYFRTALLVAVICAAGLLVDIFAGSYLLHKWLNAKLDVPPALPIILGIYFSLWMVSVMHFNILAATGKLNLVGKAYLVEGALAVALGSVLTHYAGATGMAAGLAIATASVNFWFLTMRVWRFVINDRIVIRV